MIPDALHLVRPEMLWGLLLLPLVLWLLNRLQSSRGHWHQHIDPDLLQHLAPNQTESRKPVVRGALPALVWVVLVFALAGPSWEQLPVPVLKSEAATVYVLDLSPSMLAEDLKPSRLVRARQKLSDALAADKEGLKGLVVYAGEAHVVTPLTDDARTLQSLVPSLSPYIMPLSGSNVEMALNLATGMLNDGQIQRGQIVLISDGITEDSQRPLEKTLSQAGYPLYVIGLGDESGAPIPLGQQGFAKDANGDIVIARNNRDLLRTLANGSGGEYRDIALGDQDLGFLQSKHDRSAENGREVERELEQWIERGHWLVWLALPLFLLALKHKPALFSLLVLGLLPTLMPMEAHATESASPETTAAQTHNLWQGLWFNPDQRGLQALESNQNESAAKLFESPAWRAEAQHRAGNYDAAVKTLQSQATDSAAHWYNLGNAQAQAGQYEDAISSYERALAHAPDMADAHYNKALVEQLKQEQEQEQEQDKADQQNQDESDQQQQASQDPSQQQDSSDESKSEQNPNPSQSSQQPQDQSEAGDDQQGDTENASPDPATESGEEDGQLDQQRGTQTDEQQELPAQASGGKTDTEVGSDEEQAQAAIDAFSDLTDEQRQAAEQWLKRIEDDPSNLLKRKFEYQYRQRKQAIRDDQWTAPENNAHERW